jgi:hypothetical protein
MSSQQQKDITTPVDIQKMIAEAVSQAMAQMAQIQAVKQEAQPNDQVKELLAMMQADKAESDRLNKVAAERNRLVHDALASRRTVAELISREVRPGLNGGASYEQHSSSLKGLLKAVEVFGVDVVESTISGKLKWTAPAIGTKFNCDVLPFELVDKIEQQLETKFPKKN